MYSTRGPPLYSRNEFIYGYTDQNISNQSYYSCFYLKINVTNNVARYLLALPMARACSLAVAHQSAVQGLQVRSWWSGAELRRHKHEKHDYRKKKGLKNVRKNLAKIPERGDLGGALGQCDHLFSHEKLNRADEITRMINHKI